MPRYFAFLRAVNVGGHVVKMEQLRQLFASLSFSGVETFIASGNVVFETLSKDTRLLEKQIEARLADTFGYEIVTFIRTGAELAGIAGYQPFSQSDLEAAGDRSYLVLSIPRLLIYELIEVQLAQ